MLETLLLAVIIGVVCGVLFTKKRPTATQATITLIQTDKGVRVECRLTPAAYEDNLHPLHETAIHVTQAMPEVLQLYYGEKKSEQDNEEGTPGTKGDEGAGDS